MLNTCGSVSGLLAACQRPPRQLREGKETGGGALACRLLSGRSAAQPCERDACQVLGTWAAVGHACMRTLSHLHVLMASSCSSGAGVPAVRRAYSSSLSMVWAMRWSCTTLLPAFVLLVMATRCGQSSCSQLSSARVCRRCMGGRQLLTCGSSPSGSRLRHAASRSRMVPLHAAE